MVCSALALVTGLVLLFTHAGDFLTRVSYDLPFALRSTRPANEAAIVYIDENSHKELEQPFTAPWDRSLHARLIDRLTAASD